MQHVSPQHSPPSASGMPSFVGDTEKLYGNLLRASTGDYADTELNRIWSLSIGQVRVCRVTLAQGTV